MYFEKSAGRQDRSTATDSEAVIMFTWILYIILHGTH